MPPGFGKGSDHDSLLQLFLDKGFSAAELAALIGAHTTSTGMSLEIEASISLANNLLSFQPSRKRRPNWRPTRLNAREMGHQLLRRNLQPARRRLTFRFRYKFIAKKHVSWQGIPGLRRPDWQVELSLRSCHGEAERFGDSKQWEFRGLHWLLAWWHVGEDDSLCADCGPLVQ